MKPRKRLAFGLRTYSNLTARRARARIDNRIFDAEMAGEGEYYTVSPRIRQLVRRAEDSIDEAYAQVADETFYDQAAPDPANDPEAEYWGYSIYDDDEDEDEDFEPDEDTEMFCDWEEDEIEDAEISAANWCECGLPRTACHLHSQNEDA
jgi:hypothetical protein